MKIGSSSWKDRLNFVVFQQREGKAQKIDAIWKACSFCQAAHFLPSTIKQKNPLGSLGRLPKV